MTTKDAYLSFKDKQNVFVDTTDNNQYKNLNLNQNYHCSIKDTVSAKDFTTDNRKGRKNDFPTDNVLKSKKDSNLWKKSNKYSTFLNFNHDSEEKNECKENYSSANNSTLSLHIAAYENSIENSAENESNECEKELSLVKKWGILNHITDSSISIKQNPFEFPRQQDDQDNRPEVMQFVASQYLLNSNQRDSNNHKITTNASQLNALKFRIGHLENEVTTLAVNNYCTFADAGKTAEHCKKMLSAIHDNVKNVEETIPEVTNTIKHFGVGTKKFHHEYNKLSAVINNDNLLWKIMNMPKMFNECIRLNEYESAFALTDFAVNLKGSQLYQQSLIKNPVDYIIDSRHVLLDELFNKFSGPLDLSTSIKIINNIRKIPYISMTQLRVSILQYRDLFLDSQITKTLSKKDYIYKLIDIFRDCMYDTIVLYLAIFPSDPEFNRRMITSFDPRWERWTEISYKNHLHGWAHKNLAQMFEFIRNVSVSSEICFEALREKLMSFASSFGRMGLDFRVFILEELQIIETRILKEKIESALQKLISKKVIHLVDSEIVEMARLGLSHNDDEDVSSLPLEMIAWDDLIIFANEIITALNSSRHTISVNQINPLFESLDNSFTSLLLWIHEFQESDDSINSAKRASQIVIKHFIPFIQAYFVSNFASFLPRRAFDDAEGQGHGHPQSMKFKVLFDYNSDEIIASKESEA